MQPHLEHLTEHCAQIGRMAGVSVPRGTTREAKKDLEAAIGNMARARVLFIRDRASKQASQNIEASIRGTSLVVQKIFGADRVDEKVEEFVEAARDLAISENFTSEWPAFAAYRKAKRAAV